MIMIQENIPVTTQETPLQDKVTRYNIGQKAIARIIAEQIVLGSETPSVREFTINMLKGKGVSLYPFSFDQLNVIYEYANKEIKYVKDISNTETLYSAAKIIKNGFGDCDDKTTIAGAMLRTIGLQTAIVYADLLNTGDFQHIFLFTFLNNRRIPFDPTISNGNVGVMVKNYYKLRVYLIL